jgi:hypothetical protein
MIEVIKKKITNNEIEVKLKVEKLSNIKPTEAYVILADWLDQELINANIDMLEILNECRRLRKEYDYTKLS